MQRLLLSRWKAAFAAAAMGSALLAGSSGAGEPATHRAAEIQPYHATELTPVHASETSAHPATDLTPVHASEIPAHQATELTPVHASEIPAHHATELTPVHASAIPAHHATELTPVHASELRAHRGSELAPNNRTGALGSSAAHGLEPYHAHLLKRDGSAGVDPVHSPGRFDTRLAGTWAVEIPSVSWTNRTYDGPRRIDTTHVGRGSALGTLELQPDGCFAWRGRGPRTAGRLVEVVPRRDARPHQRYWLLSDGAHAYYAALEGSRLVLYSPGTNLYAAEARRVR